MPLILLSIILFIHSLAVTAETIKAWCIVDIPCTFELKSEEDMKYTFLSTLENCSVETFALTVTSDRITFMPSSTRDWPNILYICRAKEITLAFTEHRARGKALGTIRFLKVTRYDYEIGQNNELRLMLYDVEAGDPGPTLGISDTLTSIISELGMHSFSSCGKDIMANAFLNLHIRGEETFEPLYLYLCYPSISDEFFLLDRVIVFNGPILKNVEQKVIDPYILVELKGVSTKNSSLANLHAYEEKQRRTDERLIPLAKRLNGQMGGVDTHRNDVDTHRGDTLGNNISFSIHSRESQDGLASVCGRSNFMWSKFDIPYYSEADDKTIVMALPIQLFGMEALICASMDKRSYSIPITSLTLDANHYFKHTFTANYMGIVSIEIHSDVHPLSEIRLIHVCDYMDKFGDLSAACKRYSGDNIFGYIHYKGKVNKNVAYRQSDAYLSVFSTGFPNEDFLPHRLAFLPDKGFFPGCTTMATECTSLTIGNIFLPRLVHEPLLPYIITLCDRWKHQHCLDSSEFDRIAGIVHPSKVGEISIRLDSQGLKVKTGTESILKLVEVKDAQYSDFEYICNNEDGQFARLKWSKDQGKVDGEPKISYTYEFRGMEPDVINAVELGKLYFLCMLNGVVKGNVLYGDGHSPDGHVQASKDGPPINAVSDSRSNWELLNVVITQTPLSEQRYTFDSFKVSNLFIKTTGYMNGITLTGVYFSRDLRFRCSSLKPRTNLALGKPKVTKRHPNLAFVEYVMSTTPIPESTGVGKESGDFWLETSPTLWSLVGRYIHYSGVFKPKEKMYRMCICSGDFCYSGGNVVQSHITFFDLNQFLPTNDIYNRLIIGRRVCLYNRRSIVCFHDSKNIAKMLENPSTIKLPDVDITYVTFDNEIGLLSVLTTNSLYVYNESLSKHIKVTGLEGVEIIASLPGITFILINGTLVAYTKKSRLNALFEGARRSYNTFLFADGARNSYHYIMDTGDSLFRINVRNRWKDSEIHIFPSDTGNEEYEILFIDETLTLCYYKFIIFSDNMASTTLRSSLNLAEHFPSNSHRIMFKVREISIFSSNYIVLFVCHFDDEVLKVFYLTEKKFHFYSDIIIPFSSIDFILTDTHIMGLTLAFGRVAPFREGVAQISQSLFQLRYIDLLDIRFHYPKVPKEGIYGTHYIFEPLVSNGILIYFYLRDESILRGTGLSLKATNGFIFGTLSFVGEITLEIFAEGLLGNSSCSLTISSNCPLGTEWNGKSCMPCHVGYYKDEITLSECLKCTKQVSDSTTKGEGSKSPSDCVCAPGTYFSNNECLKCPSGTYSHKYGSYACLGKCEENEVSTVVGASSLSELNCMCIQGYYRSEGACKECLEHYYCPGGTKEPIACGNGMITMKVGTSAEDCMCTFGFEWTGKECIPCNIMSYKDFVGNAKCMQCSSDSELQLYTMKLGAQNKNDCRFCKPGYYNSESSLYCISCPPNSFCFGARSKPISCGPNSITTVLLATNASDCFCLKGFGHSRFGRNDPNVPQKCTKCPINTFQHLDGGSQCMQCPENTYGTYSSSLLDCLPLPGYYNTFGPDFQGFVEEMELRGAKDQPIIQCHSVDLESVPSNVSLQPSLQACLDLCKSNVYCRYIYYVSHSGLPTYSEISTFYRSQVTDYSPCMLFYEAPKMATAGSYEGSTGDGSAVENNGGSILCRVGRAIEEKLDRVRFTKCPRNYYCKETHKFGMRRCPDNSTTLFIGASSIEDCLCMPGYEPSLLSSQKICVPCGKGFYKFERSNEQCRPCPNGMTTMEIGSNHINKCACPPNFFASPVSPHPTMEEPDALVTGMDLLNFECKNCPQNHYCPGFWSSSGNVLTHTPPIPCPPGSTTLSSSRNVGSVSSCFCGPGYGVVHHIDRLQSCEKCPPGTFKETFDNSGCTGRCSTYSTSLPGASSDKSCFCLPGWFMVENNVCMKCIEGAICPGGFVDYREATRLSDDIRPKRKSFYNHAMPLPGIGHVIIYKRMSSARRSVGPWHPDKENLYLTRRPSERLFILYDAIPDIHPCAYSYRRNMVNTFSCSEGSSGYICGSCERGYDVEYFQSMCTKCSSTPVELARMLLPRLALVLAVLALCFSARHANLNGEFSLITIFKILNVFTLSLVPLGLFPITSVSSLRRFHWLFHLFFYYPIYWFAHVERVGCWERHLRKFSSFLNDCGLPREIFDGSEALDYKQIWYMQRLVGSLKPLVDVMLVALIFPLWNRLYQRMFRRRFYERVTVMVTYGVARRPPREPLRDEDQDDYSGLSMDDQNEHNGHHGDIMDIQSPISVTNGSVEWRALPKGDSIGCSFWSQFLLQNIMVIIMMHVPGLCLNSLSMVWCRDVRYKGEDPIQILLHLPNQECNMDNKLFRFGFMASTTILIITFLFSTFIFISLFDSDYDANSWKSILMMGYRPGCRWWDVVHLFRQFFVIVFVVAQHSVDPRGGSEYVRLLSFLAFNISFLMMHLWYSPYDHRGDDRFHRLESYVFITNIFISLFIHGSYFYDFSNFGGVPILLAFFAYFKIISSFLLESATVLYVQSKPTRMSYLEYLFSILPPYSSRANLRIYFDYKRNVMVFTRGMVVKRSFFSRLEHTLLNLKVNPSESRRFLISAIKDILSTSIDVKNFAIIPDTFIYFVVRLTFWFSYCMHLEVSTNLSREDRMRIIIFLYTFHNDDAVKGLLLPVVSKWPLGRSYSLHMDSLHLDPSSHVDPSHFTPLNIIESQLVDDLFSSFYDIRPISMAEFYYALLSLQRLGKSMPRLYALYEAYCTYFEASPEEEKVNGLKRQVKALRASVEQRKPMLAERENLSQEIADLKHEIGKLELQIEERIRTIAIERSAEKVAQDLQLGVETMLVDNLTHEDILESISKLEMYRETRSHMDRRDGILVPILKLEQVPRG